MFPVGAIPLQNAGEPIQIYGHLRKEQLKSLKVLRRDWLIARRSITVCKAYWL